MTGDVTVEIYGKVEYSSTTEDLTGTYDNISFVGKTNDAEISITRNGQGGYISGGVNDCNVSFTNLILSKPAGDFAGDAGFMNVYFTTYRTGNVTYTNCTFPNGACAQGTNDAYTATYTNCTFANTTSGKYSLWVYANCNVIVNGGSFTGIRGVKMYGEGASKTGNLELDGVTFTSSVIEKPAIVLTYGESVTIKQNNTFNNVYNKTGTATTFELDLDGQPNGTPINSELPVTCYNDKGACGVLCDGKIYTTVADAAAVATSGSTVTLLHNSTETVTLPAGVTLDKNGYTADGVTETAPVEVATYDALVAALANGGAIKLTADIIATGAVDGTDANINLNGKTLTLNVGGNNFFGNSKVENGNINITGCVASGDCIIGIGDYSNSATLTFDNVNVTGDGYSSAYAVLYVYNSSELNINGGSVVVSNDNASAGGVIKAHKAADGKINIVGTQENLVELTFNNAKIGILDGTVLMNYVDLDIIGGANAINQSALTIKNSTLDITGADGRALTLSQGNVIVENSTLNFADCTEGEIRFKKSLELTTDYSSTISACKTYADASAADAKINGVDVDATEASMAVVTVENGTTTVKEAPQGNDFTGYTAETKIWGETWGNASESFVIKVLDANGNVMGTTSLNNVGGIIDGDVNVTWNLKLDAASNTDEYWTMEWTTAPTIDNMPAKVELWVDGVKVSDGDVVLNAPDNLNKIYAAVTDNAGKIYSYHTSIANAVDAITGTRSAEQPNVIALLRDTDEIVELPVGVTLNLNGFNAPKVSYPVASVNGTTYTDLQEAIVAAVPKGTVELLTDVTVDKWIMITQSLNIGTGQLITVDEINGLTIDGNNHSLTIKSIESASNGNRLFFDATKLNIKDLTINYEDAAENQGGICLTSGTIENVTFNGGGNAILPGTGEITVKGCTFKTNGSAIYNEQDRDNLVVIGNTFKTAEGKYAIYLRGTTKFTNNTVIRGRVNVVNGSPIVTGNDFGTERFKVYNVATATIEENTINNLVFNDESVVYSTFENNELSENAQTTLENMAVAQIGDVKYLTVTAAINAASDGATVQLLGRTINEYVAPWATDTQHTSEKSITIVGAENFGTTMTGGLYLGYDDSQCREHTIVVKGINFTGKGILVASQQNVTIEGNKFTDITDHVASSSSADKNAISIIGKDVIATVKNNVITTTASIGIDLRNILTATVDGNTVTGTQHNSMQIQNASANSSAVIANNRFFDWGKGGEGRAMRINQIVTADVNNNVMINENAPEEFVKITGHTTANIDKNYWNGENPTTEHTPAYYLVEGVEITSYYKEFNAETNELSNLIDFTKLPNAEVICLGAVTVTEYNVYNGSLIEGTETLNVPVVMEFIANDTPEEAQANPFGEYTTDFYITFDGIKEESFVADGCYLIGHYGDFGWIQIPVDGLEIENGVTYPVITSNGLDFSYINICTSVKDFKCGIYIAPEILTANPDMTVQLELGLSEDIYAAQAAQFITVDEPYVYDVDVLSGKVAKVGETTYTTLAEAVAAANNEETVELLISAQGSGIVINKNVTIDFGGFTYTFNSPVGSTGTQTLGFQIRKEAGSVTLENGKLNVAEEAGEAFAMLIQNYADLTITNMTLDGDHLDHNNYSYVLSVNCGDVVINGSTSILANENEVEGEKHFAFDSYDYSAGGYTELPTVTVNTTGAIMGAVEVSATLNLNAIGKESNISYITLDGEGQLHHFSGFKTTIKKNITGHVVPENNSEYVGGWYTISSPVGEVAHSKVGGLINGTHDLYRYNEVTMTWENVKVTENNFTTLEVGRGYLYANSANTELSFTGTLNTAAAGQKLTITGNALSGFNLVGNPFTYNITKANMSGATLANGFYTLSNHGAWQANAEDATIAPMQGALIKATETTGNFTIAPNSAKRSESENNGQIKIEVSNDNYNDVAYVSFNEGIGLDKIEHRNANIPMVYVPVGGVNYAIAMMNQDVTEIPVSFRAMTMGQYTISAEAQDCEYAIMTLVDRLTGTETNLLMEDYTFVATTKDNADRFIIKLAIANANGENEDNFAYINNGMMYIYNIEGQGMVSIYDVTGRPVVEYNVETSASIPTSELTTGVYIIRMTDNNGVKVQKILID